MLILARLAAWKSAIAILAVSLLTLMKEQASDIIPYLQSRENGGLHDETRIASFPRQTGSCRACKVYIRPLRRLLILSLGYQKIWVVEIHGIVKTAAGEES